MNLPVGTRRVLVTGGGTGIGRAVAEALVDAGGRVVVCGRRLEPLEALAAAHPGSVVPLAVDLADPTARQALLGRAKQALGGLDGLVHSAGLAVHEPPDAIDEEALRAQLEVNLVAPLRLGADALDELEPGGAVVFVSSTLALRPLPSSTVYSAAKAGMLAAMRSLAVAGAPRGLRYNTVVPGVVDTDMARARRHGETDEDVAARLESLRALHLLGRLGTPADIAHVIIHLLGAPWTTGIEYRVDGGQLLRE